MARNILDETHHASFRVALDPAAARGLGRLVERDRSERAIFPARAFERPRVARHQGIAVDHERGTVDVRGGVAQRPAGPERLGLDRPRDAHPVRGAVAQRLAQPVGADPRAQHDVAYVAPRQPFELVREERAPGERRERLGQVAETWAKPRPESARQHERLHAPSSGL